jgi:prophage regulatory protein
MRPDPITTDRLLRLRDVMTITRRSRTSIYHSIATASFPRPVKLGRSSAWPESEVQRWIEARKAERGTA